MTKTLLSCWGTLLGACLLVTCGAIVPHESTVLADDTTTAAIPSTGSTNAGVATLDRAVDRRLSADSLQDLIEVMTLVERAQREGLSGDYATFADDLLAATALQRGIAHGTSLLEILGRLPSPLDGWEEQRDIAAACLRRGLAHKSEETRAWLVLAKLAALPGGDRAEAKTALEHAVQAEETDVRLEAILLQASLTEGLEEQGKLIAVAEEIATAAGQTNVPEILELKAKWLGASDRWDEATDVVKALLDAAPDNLKAIDLAITILAAGKRFDDALDVIAVMEKRVPNHPAILLVKATILAAKKTEVDTQAALEIFSALREQYPDDPRYLLVRGQFHLERKAYDLAFKDAEAALRLKDDLGEAFLLKYRVLLLQEKFDEAESVLDALEKLAGLSLALELERATLFTVAKRSRKTLDIVDGLLAITPDNIAALQLKGQALISLGRHPEAVAVLTQVLEIDASLIVATNNLAWLLATSPDDAVRDGKRALELATKAAEATEYREAFILSTLAAAYAETGDFALAMKWSQECLQRAEEEGDDRIDDMRRELESYKKNEPFRERVEEQTDEEPTE